LAKGSGRARRLVLRAAAKVNLALEVLRRRDDGYHEIATVMQTIDLTDRLVLEDHDSVELESTAPDVPTDGTNLAVLAAVALRDAAGTKRGVRVRLDKRVPVAAGLGGGSTDAAAVLLGLNQMWGLRWPVRRLASVAETLGMDVPFFLRGGSALATGRGERLTAVRAGAFALVLVNPRIGVSAAEAYARLTPSAYSDGGRARDMVAALASRRPIRVAAALHNALEAPVASTVPQIAQMKAALMAAGALGTVMSGSGPTVLGVARSFEHARQIRARLTRVSWACWAVRTVGGPAVRVERRH